MRSLLCLVLALAACKDDARPPPPPARTKRSLVDQLAYEAAHRTPGKIDAVLAAFAKASLDVTDVKQLVADTVGAKYCTGGTVGKVAIAICEYESPSAATAAREHVTTAFPVPGRTIVVNGALTLTMTGTGDARALLEQVFAAM